MSPPKLAVYKYEHDQPLEVKPLRALFTWIGFIPIGLAFYFHGLKLGIPLLLAYVFLLIRTHPSKSIRLSSRYLLCGNQVLYYRNVDQVVLDHRQGHLLLLQGGKRLLRLERDKFPTGARKPPKIKANRAAKFTKVSEKIIGRVQAFCPEASVKRVEEAQA